MCISSLRFARSMGIQVCCGLGRTTNSFENLIISSFRPAESRQRPQMRVKIPTGPPSAPRRLPKVPLGTPNVPPRCPKDPPMPPQGSPEGPKCHPKSSLGPPEVRRMVLKAVPGPLFSNEPTNQSQTSDLQTPTSYHECDGADVGCPVSWGRRQGALAR